MYFHANGVEMTVASPKGRQMPIDPRTNPTAEQEEEWNPALEAAAATVPVAGLVASDFDAVFLPEGMAPCSIFLTTRRFKNSFAIFTDRERLSLRCATALRGWWARSGPTASPLVSGVTLTAYTYGEEVSAKLDKEVPLILEERLRELGANFIARKNKAEHLCSFWAHRSR